MQIGNNPNIENTYHWCPLLWLMMDVPTQQLQWVWISQVHTQSWLIERRKH